MSRSSSRRPRAPAAATSADEFSALDSDHDGVLDEDDVREALRQRHMRADLAPRVLADMGGRAGARNVTNTQFSAFVARREAEVRAAFDAVDTNGNGVLEAGEVAAALRRLNIVADVPGVAQRLLDAADANRDARLDFDEFRAYVLLFPSLAQEDIFQQWMQMAVHAIDLGETAARVPHTTPHDMWATLVAGGLSGAASRTATAPLDRVKVLKQAWSGVEHLHSRTSVVDSLHEIVRTEGWRRLWAGNGANVIKVIPESATKFFVYDAIRSRSGADLRDVTIGDRFAAGGIAGVVATVVSYPLELAKTRLATGAAHDGLVRCLASIYRHDGVRGLYRGLGPSCVGIIPYAGADLAIFHSLKHRWLTQHGQGGEVPPALTLMGMGAVSGMCGQLLAYPLQLVRTRMQNDHQKEFRNSFECARHIVRQHGYRALYRGLVANFSKAVPSVSISYLVYEKARAWFGGGEA